MTGSEAEPVALGRVEGIDSVEELVARLRAAAAGGGTVQVDGSRVLSLDSTTLQALVALQRDVRRAGGAVSWVGVSPKLLKAAALVGLTEELGF